jgi:all-trans-retinol dehydrogenase (NAD+)
MEPDLMNRRITLSSASVLITGGASGLGRQMAIQAAKRGARVVIWDRDADGAHRVRDEIHAADGAADAFVVDITDRAAVAATARATGDVDVVINNAGIVTGDWFLDAKPENIERTFQVNVLALYWVTRAFLQGMMNRDRGCIVTVASAAGLVGVAQQTDYSATKFAAVGFMESLRAELRSLRSPVNALTVSPFYIDTGMFDGVQSRFPALLPILNEDVVAGQILDAIERGRATLVLPPFARVLPLVRLLPVRAFDRVADFFGINRTMEHFRGRRSPSRGTGEFGG